jgi:hypothetical protein
MILSLCSPLFYASIDKIPAKIQGNEEYLLYFELDSVQSISIEPDKERLPGSLVFTGKGVVNSGQKGLFEVSAGKYLFTQYRGEPEWLDMAVEQQKDALWERCIPDNKLYVRFLYEDGSGVTQLLRPLKPESLDHVADVKTVLGGSFHFDNKND